MPLDTAREIAAEAGYLHPDADINDLLAAIDRNQGGRPVFSDRDATTAADWLSYETARPRGVFEPSEMPPLPGEPASWDAAAAARYRAAADATRAQAQTFNSGRRAEIRDQHIPPTFHDRHRLLVDKT